MAKTVNAGNINISIKADGSSVNATTDEVSRSFKKLSESSVSSMQATSASLRLVEGGLTNNIRAAERFLSQFSAMRSIVQAAFPVAGLVAVGGILGEMVGKIEHAYEAFKNLQRAPIEMRAAFNDLTGALKLSNDALDVSNAKLEQQIAKLQGKPINNTALALAEARQQADKLSESLRGAITSLDKLLSEKGIGSAFGFATNQASTPDLQKMTQAYRDQINQNTATINDPAKLQAANLALTVKLQTDLNNKQKEALDLQKKYTAYESQPQTSLASGNSAGAPVMNRTVGAAPPDQSGRLSILYDAAANMAQVRRQQELESKGLADRQTLDGLNAAKENAAPMKPYNDALAELAAKYQGLLATQKSSLSTDPVTKAIGEGAARATELIAKLNEALKNANHAPLSQQQRFNLFAAENSVSTQEGLGVDAKQAQERTKERLESADRFQNELTESIAKHQDELAKLSAEVSAAQNRLAQAGLGPEAAEQAKIAEQASKTPNDDSRALVQQKLELDHATNVKLATRAIDEQTAALQMQLSVYGKGIAAAREAELLKIRTSGKDTATIDAEIAQKKAEFALEDVTSGSARGGGTFLDGLEQWQHAWADSMESSAAITKRTLGSTIEGINDQLAKMITGQQTSWAKLFMSIAEGMAKTGLTIGEQVLFGGGAGDSGKGGSGGGGAYGGIFGSLLGGLLHHGSGGGGSAPDQVDYNTPAAWNDPDNGNAGVGGSSGGGAGIGGFIGSIFGSIFGGLAHHAAGGDIGGGVSIVGENGPELFASGPGHITPNHKLGGTTNVYYNVDARGSSDSAATRQQVVKGLTMTHQSAVSQSLAAMTEQRKRRPISG